MARGSFEDLNKLPVFDYVEKCITSLNLFVKGTDLQFDIETPEGSMACKSFLHHLENLFELLQCRTADRFYREDFTKAYKILYTEGKLSYLTEILDSAQEGNIISSSNPLCEWRKVRFFK